MSDNGLVVLLTVKGEDLILIQPSRSIAADAAKRLRDAIKSGLASGLLILDRGWTFEDRRV